MSDVTRMHALESFGDLMQDFELGFYASVFSAAQVVLKHLFSIFVDELVHTVEIKLEHKFADAIL